MQQGTKEGGFIRLLEITLNKECMNDKDFDVLIIGGGVLGTTLAYWVSQEFDSKIAIIERSRDIALHQSMRNTGVIHRPFYLNPAKKRVWAFSAQVSFKLWKYISVNEGAPWKNTGTIEIAKREEDMKIIDEYQKWAIQNGMNENEVEIMDEKGLAKLEPNVKGYGAIYSRTDASVDFQEFAIKVFERANKYGVKLIGNTTVKKIDQTGNCKVYASNNGASNIMKAKVIINCAGGGALKLAKSEGLGKGYTNLFFRGDYWKVKGPLAQKIISNIYTVPEHPKYPFLDPHFIVRYNGVNEVGPTATLVSNPYAYKDKYSTLVKIWKNLLERPVIPKLNLLLDKEFRELAKEEWKSSIYSKSMVARIKKFIPSFKPEYLSERGMSGVRAQVIDKNGFVPEAIILLGHNSLHILNYNSPGATGAPAFSALLLEKMKELGYFDGIQKRGLSQMSNDWNLNKIIEIAPGGLIDGIIK
ncbi:MAG: FAD-dependent oxidoreductase [Thermoprotei archaeon]